MRPRHEERRALLAGRAAAAAAVVIDRDELPPEGAPRGSVDHEVAPGAQQEEGREMGVAHIRRRGS